jgi:peroxiredoxin
MVIELDPTYINVHIVLLPDKEVLETWGCPMHVPYISDVVEIRRTAYIVRQRRWIRHVDNLHLDLYVEEMTATTMPAETQTKLEL